MSVTTVSPMTAFRDTIATVMGRELKIDILPGILDGPALEHTVGCCWPNQEAEISYDVQQALFLAFLRVLLPYAHQQDEHVPAVDPAPLEEIAFRVQRITQSQQLDLGGWYARVTRTDYDVRLNMVTFSFQATAQNLAVLPV